MQHGEKLRVACGEVLIGFIPLLALLPPGLRETHACGVAFGLEAELRRRPPENTDRDALATYVLAVMEGGVMLSR